MLLEISNILQGIVANYSVNSETGTDCCILRCLLWSSKVHFNDSLLAFVLQAKLCYAHVSLGLAESARSFSPTD